MSIRLHFRLALACTALVGALSAQAATASHTGPVTLVYPMNDSSFAVGSIATDAPACSSSGSTRYMYVTPGQNGVTLDGAKAMLATVLAAFSAGNTVSIVYDDSSLYCYINRLLIE